MPKNPLQSQNAVQGPTKPSDSGSKENMEPFKLTAACILLNIIPINVVSPSYSHSILYTVSKLNCSEIDQTLDLTLGLRTTMFEEDL